MVDEGLYSQIRERAAKRGDSVSSIVAEALRSYLASEGATPKRPFKVTVSTGTPLIPVDKYSTAELLDIMDADLSIEKSR